MSKLIGSVNWISQPDFPVFKYAQGGYEAQFKYICSADNLNTLPAYGSALSALSSIDPRLSTGGAYAWLAAYAMRMRDLTITPGASGNTTFTVAINFGSEVEAPSANGIISDLSEYDNEEQNVPVEQHPDYKTNWNNHLICVEEITDDNLDAVPDWFYTATDKVIPAADRKLFKWLSQDAEVPNGWFMAWPVEAMFRGVNAYLSGVPTVTRTIKSTAKNALENNAEADFHIQSPPDTFGISGGQWLRGKSSIGKDGRFWVLRVQYRHFKEINDKLYKS